MPSSPVITNSMAARVLGVTPQNLRRWVREGKFNGAGEVEWDKSPTFRRQRAFTREWIQKVAAELGVDPDWTVLDGQTGSQDSA